MSRIAAVDPATVQGKAKDMLDAVNKLLGVTPNLFRVTAQSPAALEGMLGLNGAMAHGKLGGKIRESIALATAESNACDYCLSAHSYLGQAAGLSEGDIAAARSAGAADARSNAILNFARAVTQKRGHVSEQDLAAVRSAGVSDGEIVEIVGHVAINIFTNYVNSVAQTDIDFPVVHAMSKAA